MVPELAGDCFMDDLCQLLDDFVLGGLQDVLQQVGQIVGILKLVYHAVALLVVELLGPFDDGFEGVEDVTGRVGVQLSHLVESQHEDMQDVEVLQQSLETMEVDSVDHGVYAVESLDLVFLGKY